MYNRIYNNPGPDYFDALNWRDLSSANSIELNLPDYKIVEATAATPNTVSATVWDWFGKTAPAGVDVDFWSNEASGLDGSVRPTRRTDPVLRIPTTTGLR